MKDFTVCICSSRPESIVLLLRSIALQTIIPKKLIIVSTYPESVITSSLQRFRELSFFSTKEKSIAYSRALALKKVTTNRFFFIDDDVIITTPTFLEDMLNETEKRNCVALAPMVLPRELSLWSLFFFNLYHLNMKYENDQLTATEYPMACMLFDRRFILKNNIRFNTKLTSGEDIDFTRQISAHHGKIGISEVSSVHHDFVTSFFSFIKKANWYASGILRTEARNNAFYGYKPTRIAHVVLLPFFYIRQIAKNATQLVKEFYIKDKMLIIPSFLFHFFILIHTVTQPEYFAKE